MPGCGKSTLGVILAKALAYDFIDSDLLIQRRAGMTLQQIIDQKGSAYFSILENEVNLSICCNHTVVATGGSVIYCDEAMKHLREIGSILYIRVPYEEIARRISNFKTRGLVLHGGATLRSLYDERQPYYERYADKTVDWTNESAEEIVEKILKFY